MTGYWPAVSLCLVTAPRVYKLSVVVPAFAQASCELAQEFPCLVIELVGHVDLYRHVVIALAAGAIRHSLAAQPQLFSARCARRDLHLGLAVDRRDRRDRSEDRAVERHPDVGRHVAAVDAQPAAVAVLDRLLELGVLRVAPPAPVARPAVLEVDVLDVDPAAAPRSAAEELAEQIAEVEHAGAAALRAIRIAAAREAARQPAVGADLVVHRALLGIAEDVVGVLDVLEPRLLGLVATGGIRMVGLGELAVRALDLLGARRLGDAERLVGVDARVAGGLLRPGLRSCSLGVTVEHDAVALDGGLELVARLEVSGEEVAGERVDHELLQRALERARAVHRI